MINRFKVVNEKSPLLEGLSVKKGDVISCPSDECDGAPLSGFDSDGFPILDNPYHFLKYELVGFDRGSRGGAETFPTFVLMKATPTSGTIVNVGSSDWCSASGMGSPISGAQIKTITGNIIRKLANAENVFTN